MSAIDRRTALVFMGGGLTAPGLAASSMEDVRQVIDAYARAWAVGDVAHIVESYGDAFTLHYFGANALSGVHAGKPAALAALQEFGRRTDRLLLEIAGTMAGAGRGAIIARERLGRGQARTDVERVLVYAVAAGKFSACWVYDSDQALIDRLVGA